MPALAPSSKRNAPFAPHTRRYAQIRGRSSKSGRVCSARAGIYPSNRRLRLQDWGLPRTRGDTTLLTQVTRNESFAPSHRGYNPAPHSGEHPWSRCEELLSRAHFTPAGVCLSTHRGFVGPDLADGAAHAECTSWTTIPLRVTTYPAHVGIYPPSSVNGRHNRPITPHTRGYIS